MYCCSGQQSKMDYKRRFLLGGSKQKVQQHQQYQMPELSRTLNASLASSCSASSMGVPGGCHPPAASSTAVADIQQGISKYLDALNVFCRASAFLTDLFSSVFRNSQYSKAAMQLKDVQEHVMEAASRLTAAIKPEIAKMLMELSAGAANFKDQNDFNLQDVEVLGRCFLTVMQVHFQFLSQTLQKVQPVAQSCLAEALAQAQERSANARAQSAELGALTELEEASRSWKGAAEATSRLRERGRDGCLAGLQVQQLFCSHNTNIPEHQLKELNIKIDTALQAYKAALESLGHSEYALKAGFHFSPKCVEAALQGCCSEAEAQQAGRMQTTSQPIQRELPTIPVQIGTHFLKGVSFNESAAENLKLKMQTMLQLIKEALGQNGVTPRDDSPVTEVLNQVCPSSWRGACKTAVQLLFAQAGLVVVDTAQIENKESYAPHITLEGSRLVVQVPSTWCLKEDPATMSLLQRSLDPEKTLGLVDVLYTAVFDINRWKERKEQSLPTIQIQLQRESPDFAGHADLTPGTSSKASSGLPKTISKLTSKFTRKVSSSSNSGGSYSIPSTPSRSMPSGGGTDDKAKNLGHSESRLHSLLQMGALSAGPDAGAHNLLANGLACDEQGMNLPTDQEMQDVIDFLSGFNMGKSQQASPLVKRRNSVASANPAELKPPAGPAPTSPVISHGAQPPTPPSQQQQQPPTPRQPSPQALQYYQHLLQPISQQQPQQPQLPPQLPTLQQRAASKWPGSSGQQPPPGGLSPLGPIGQWGGSPGLPDLSSDLYSLGLVSTYMDSVMSEVLGQKPQGPRNNTWPNRDQSDGVFGALGDTLPFDPAVGSDPEFARYVAGVSQAMQQKRQVQHPRRPSNPRSNWPMPDEQHRTWMHPEFYSEGEAVSTSWSANQGDSASSSDETSSANGDSLFSMFSGPDLVAAVKQRRKHSCGEPEACTLPSPALHHVADDNQDSKTKTWPPKAPWQHSAHGCVTDPTSSLYHQINLAPPSSSQWSDSMQMLRSPVWAAASGGGGDCSPSSAAVSSPFPFSQQQQLKGMKAFKSFPLKHEHRSSFLHQY
ncbi:granule associated Rac and RHOG effector protein 1-like [Corythoichthys intestinalis]|uniref:granule associated Rac and RHOG effector protein 1-like n=1 Tax=Corythoichthys intestinalis TaxID=161448 RepID=UPI0025A66C83|nr:granule associated Rac and RHOG effector protein 1-like [Corythoichthys intestinalis]XP_057686861.1 granule associated Rac and RHOG effector protein 1-like [Corythoichthys intestinalis]XP_061796797.1 granule associated Rac and RHOG effector protein 1-like [Nerophis lumbriciformis]